MAGAAPELLRSDACHQPEEVAAVNWEPGHVLKSLEDGIWKSQPEAMPVWKARLMRLVRLVVVLIRDVATGQLTLRSMSLVYTTLLSLVPLLALSFSVLKAFGVHNQLEPMLNRFLAPLGEKGTEISLQIVSFIDNMNVGVLGSLGLALLIYTAVSLMQKIEESFNHIWHVTQPRSLGERFSRYVSMLIIGPILVFAALGLTATLTNVSLVRQILAVEPFGRLAYELGRLAPYFLVVVAFTLIYAFIPNTRVKAVPAMVGGLVGGVLWQSAGLAFALFVSRSTQYDAIYSSFAILILFMIWLYVSWLILLFGADVAFYVQHPEYIVPEGGEPRLSNRMRERLALAIMSLVTGSFLAGQEGWTMSRLTQTLGVPMHAVDQVLDALQRAGVLVQTNSDPPEYVPGRDPASISVKELWDSVRCSGEDRYLSPPALPVPEQVEQVLLLLEQAATASLSRVSVKELAASPQAQVLVSR
jgi:membrane protein